MCEATVGGARYVNFVTYIVHAVLGKRVVYESTNLQQQLRLRACFEHVGLGTFALYAVQGSAVLFDKRPCSGCWCGHGWCVRLASLACGKVWVCLVPRDSWNAFASSPLDELAT